MGTQKNRLNWTYDFSVLDIDIGLDKQNFERKIVNIFLPLSFNICFMCSKEPSH